MDIFKSDDYQKIESPQEPTEVLGNVSEENPFEVIRAISKVANIPISDPNKNCKKCYGRGYLGVDTKNKMPVPCKCIFPKEKRNLNIPLSLNRKMKRRG